MGPSFPKWTSCCIEEDLENVYRGNTSSHFLISLHKIRLLFGNRGDRPLLAIGENAGPRRFHVSFFFQNRKSCLHVIQSMVLTDDSVRLHNPEEIRSSCHRETFQSCKKIVYDVTGMFRSQIKSLRTGLCRSSSSWYLKQHLPTHTASPLSSS